MTESRRNLGIWGESKAVEHLVDQGYIIHDRNVRTTYGEIDIVAGKGEITVFVEVKTRSSQTFGYPEEAITPKKRENLINSAQAYMAEHPELDIGWQIDVIAIQQVGPESPKIVHFENAIST